MTATLLPIPDTAQLEAMRQAWPDPVRWPFRSRWLTEYENSLRLAYPMANSDSLSLTARHHAPFWLRDGPDVP